MPPTLPTELIKHILEFVYEGVRELEAPHAPFPPFPSVIDGERVPHIFYPFLFVSKTFHALALPFLVRQLFTRPYWPQGSEEEAQANSRDLITLIEGYGLEALVKSVTLPASLSETQHNELIKVCSAVEALQITPSIASSTLLYLPSTITHLLFYGEFVLAYSDLIVLQQNTPRLTTLAFGGVEQRFGVSLKLTEEQEIEFQEIQTPWKLVDVDLGRLRGSATPVLCWLRDSAPTLRTLSTGPIYLDHLHWRWDYAQENFLEELQLALPALVALRQHWKLGVFGGESNPLDAETLPNLAILEVKVGKNTVEYLQEISPSLRRVHLSLIDDDDEFLDLPFVLQELSAFITGHPALGLVVIESPDFDEEVAEPWSEPLRALCAERGIIFACDDEALMMDNGDEEYEPSDTGTTDDESSIGSSGIEEELDFDAEDDEIWARQWSEEKREGMGLVDEVEVEEVEEAEASAPIKAETAPSAEIVNESAEASLATVQCCSTVQENDEDGSD